MDRERIGIDARICQLGRHRSARCLTAFERLVRLLRWGLVVGWMWRAPRWRPTAGWIVLLSASVLFYLLSLLLSACERLLKNRWMQALRQGQSCSVVDVLAAFSRCDIPLAMRIAMFYRMHLLARTLCLLSLPTCFTAAAVWFVFNNGVSRSVFVGGAVCLFAMWLAALLFLTVAREPLCAAVSLLIDRQSFAQRKSCHARLDKDCFRLAGFSFLWMPLPGGARFQARALYALIRQ